MSVNATKNLSLIFKKLTLPLFPSFLEIQVIFLIVTLFDIAVIYYLLRYIMLYSFCEDVVKR